MLLGVLLTGTLLTGCGKNKATEAASESAQTEKEGTGERTADSAEDDQKKTDETADTKTDKKAEKGTDAEETGEDALKLEGGEEVIDAIRRIIGAGMPVMGHLGLMPQSINKYGTYGVRAKGDAEAEKLVRDAHLLEEAGCFALVLEKIPADLAKRVASELTIPVIGIGAGGAVDGQVLVVADMLGMTKGFSPRFLRRYADLHTVMTDAIGQYVADVKSSDFPNESEQY